MKKLLFAVILLLGLAVIVPSCVKTEFDEPPTTGTPVDVADSDVVTIKELKDLHVSGQFETIADLDNGAFKGKYLRGVITADDETGNFYRNFIMQDETGGISILQSRTDAYPFYSIGREVYIKLEGLVMGDFRGVVQLGGFISSDNRLEEIVNVDEFILQGQRGTTVTPNVTTINALGTDDISTLITLEEVEFANGDFQLTYSDGVNQNTENRDVKDCDGNVIVVRTSGFADFAGTDIPDGNGTITGIYSIFESGTNVTQQLLIRGTYDVVMENERCDGSGGGGGGGPTEPVSELYEDFNSFADGDVFSKAGWSNIALVGSRQWRIGEFQGVRAAEFTGFQAPDAALEGWLITPAINLPEARFLSFTSAFAFYAHDAIEVLISTDYDGINPGTATWENLNPTLASNSANEWNEYVESGVIDISSYGSVGHIAFKYTGDNTNNTTNWLIDDIRIGPDQDGSGGGGGGGGGTDEPLEELILDLESLNYTDNQEFNEAGWTNTTTVGSEKWYVNIFDDNFELRHGAFQIDSPDLEAWLVTPAINFDNPKKMSFLNGHAFHVHDGLTTWFSGDFTGDPATATWTEITVNYANSSLPNYETVSTGDIDLSGFSGTGFIGFRYQGNPAAETTTWIIDDLRIEDQ